MGDDQPRYGLRPSPKKAAPHTPTRAVPASPKRVASPHGRAQVNLFSSRDESVSLPPPTSASRKITFGAPSSSSLASSSVTASTDPLRSAGLASATTFEPYGLRGNARYFSAATLSYKTRPPSTSCLPVASLETKLAAAAPVVPLQRQSKSRLEPLLVRPDSQDSSFVRPPPLPPRRTISVPTSSSSSSSTIGGGQSSGQLLQKAGGLGGGLSRSLATTRLQPAARSLLLQEEDKEKAESSSAGTAAAAVDQPDHQRSSRQEKWCVPPPRRTLSSSASVASLRLEAPEVAPRSAVRVRPASPSRIAKSNSGLLRSYSSVVIGAKRTTADEQEAEPVLPVQRVPPPPPRLPSPRKRADETTTVAREGSSRGGGVVSIASIVLAPHKEEKVRAPSPRQNKGSLTPSASTSALRPTYPRLPHSASSTVLSFNRAEIKKSRQDPVVVPSSKRSIEEVDEVPTSPLLPAKKKTLEAVRKFDLLEGRSPPVSPATRSSLKRQRLHSGADSDAEVLNHVSPAMKSFLPSFAATSTPTSTLPSSSFFLRDDVLPEMTEGNAKNETTPKPARRSKKMRRLEMENGDVDEEARDLAFENMKKTPSNKQPRARDSPCQVVSRASSTYGTPLGNRGGEKEEEMDEGWNQETATLTPVRLPPAPERSALRKERMEKSGRSIRFAHCHVFLFGRDQGYTCVPSHGEVCLGMEARHHDEERHSLDGSSDEVPSEGTTTEGEGGMEEELSEGEIQPLVRVPRLPSQSSPRRLPPGEKYTTRHIEALTSKQRSRMLKTSGIKITREHTTEHDLIRQQRRECGCSCEGGRCRPETCECARDGIPCQVDTEEGPFPCRCRADTCQNDQGRVEFNPQHVHEHYQRTFARLKLCARMGDDTLASPSLIRFTDDDEAPRHNATSYLATPPPAIYQSPTLSTAQSAVLQFVTPPTQAPCTPPMQQQNREAANAAGTNDASAVPAHARFPVTPVYKKYAAGGGGERANREIPLSRLAIFKAASTTTVPPVPVDSPRSVNDDNLDESMDTSAYATPPESNSPETATLVATVPDPQNPSPRKFASFQSLI